MRVDRSALCAFVEKGSTNLGGKAAKRQTVSINNLVYNIFIRMEDFQLPKAKMNYVTRGLQAQKSDTLTHALSKQTQCKRFMYK